jgi:hypothetical protein
MKSKYHPQILYALRVVSFDFTAVLLAAFSL